MHDWLKAQDPDLIFFVGGNSGFVYDIVSYISDYLKVKIVTFFTDDYIIHPIHDNFYSKCHLSLLMKKYNAIVKKSVKKYCIGEKMAQEYSDFFSTSFGVIMNLIDVSISCPKDMSSPIKKISYLGGLHLHRWKAISKIASQLPKEVKVHVYTFQPIVGNIKKAFDDSGVIYHNGLTGDALHEVIVESDALLHVESDDPEYKAITMLSVSTKIPEYLVSCRPILAIGPSEVASMRLLSQNNIGFVIDSRSNSEDIQDLVNVFLTDAELRLSLVSKGYEYAKANFDRKIKAMEFKNEISVFCKHLN